MFSVGDKVGDYEIVARLKSGGMATLFLARRQGAAGFAKHVAIKVVHPHLAEDPAFVRMFVDEALLSAKIDHPNVVHVEELRELEGNHFLVMEYVDGCALAQLMRELAKQKRRMTPELAVYVATRIADGLHAAHELKDASGQSLGVVHRDVSPQNVLLAWQGHVKLIDFGVAKARDRSQQTTGASLKGKIRYMSPEQAYGKPLDRRSDVYALGIVLWEMLTMQRCFRGDNDLALIDAVRNPAIPPPSTVVPEIPPELDAAVMGALAPDPDQRFPSAQALRRALAEALPRALALDASHLGELLHAVMGDQVERSRGLLPASLAGVKVSALEARAADAEEALKTMTISQADLASFVDFPSDDGPQSPPPRSEPRPEPRPEEEPRRPDGPAVVVDSSLVEAPPAAGGSSRTMLWAALALVVAGLLFVGGALAFLSTREEEGPVVTPLADPAREVDAGGGAPSTATADHEEDVDPSAETEQVVADAGAVAEADEAEVREEPATTSTGREDAERAAEERRAARRRAAREARERRQRAAMGSMEETSMGGVPLADDFGF